MSPASSDRSAVPPPAPWGIGGEIEQRLVEMTYEVAAASLEHIISPSLADFIA